MNKATKETSPINTTLRADRFVDHKIQYIQIKFANKTDEDISRPEISYPDIIEFLESEFIRNKYIKYKGGLYVDYI